MEARNNGVQLKVDELSEIVRHNFYLCRDDLEVNGSRYNSALLFGTLTELNKGNMLLFGEYGGGKTTSAEYLNSIFNGLPLDLVKRVAIRGNPQLTEEKMIGRPDYGKMHKGEEEVVWQHFVQIGPKIFDEFNRLPESNQSVVLNGIDRGEWNYLNDFISTGRQPFFATCNYADSGNNRLIPPILDRFDVAVESKFPGVHNVLEIARDYNNDKDQILSDPILTREALGILSSCESKELIQQKLKEITRRHQQNLLGYDIPILTDEELIGIERDIREISFDREAEQYFAFLVAEMNTSQKYGQKRSIDPISTENGLYLQAAFTGSGSRRAEKSIVRYSKSLAWLQRENTVNLETVLRVAPYILWHRVAWTPGTENTFKEDTREDPMGLYITKTLLGDGTNERPGVIRRFKESSSNHQRVIDLIGHGNLQKAKMEAEEYSAKGKGHPIFQDILKELKEL